MKCPRRNRRKAGSGTEKGIGHADAAVVLAMAEVLSEEFSTFGRLRGGQDAGVPAGDGAAFLESQGDLEHGQIKSVVVARSGRRPIPRMWWVFETPGK